MSLKDLFKKFKKGSGLSKYTDSELETLKALYEKQLDDLETPDSFDVSEIKLSSDICVNSYDGNAHIRNQIKNDLSDVLAEIHKRKSELGYEKEA